MKTNKLKLNYLFSFVSLFLISSCSSPKTESNIIAESAIQDITCKKQNELFHEKIYDLWIKNTEAPTSEQIKQQLINILHEEKITQNISKEIEAQLIEKIVDYYDFLTHKAPSQSNSTASKDRIALLASLEIGDRTSKEKIELQDEFINRQTQLNNFISNLDLNCRDENSNSDSESDLSQSTNPTNPQDPISTQPSLPQTLPDSEFNDPSTKTRTKILNGLKAVFATVYQSCNVLNLEPIDQFTPTLEGVRISGSHSDGVGRKRIYASVPKIIQTHNYYKNVEVPKKNCFDARKTPLIYDYGGKPYAGSSSESQINFFKNSGSGTSVLGIDCSAFVGSIVARSGFRLSPNKSFKAIQVSGLSSAMFANPKSNGLSCFDKITVSKDTNIKPGDIIAGSGHVVIIDSVGIDPFGISDITSIDDCIEGVISHKKFNFVIAQSSPYKNAIGISRSDIKDYLDENLKMQSGLIKYALSSCKAKFTGTILPKVSEISIIRHSESPDCILPKPIGLQYESCVQECI